MRIKISQRPKIAVRCEIVDNALISTHLALSDNFTLHFPKTSNKELIDSITKWMIAYANKSPTQLPINLSKQLTPFSHKVLQMLSQVSFGSTITYGALAKAANSPKAYRAVGTVCNKNVFPLLIPCHRVISKSGLGGFAYPLDLKKELLQFEQC